MSNPASGGRFAPQNMSANVAPRGFSVLCRRLAEFSESLMPAKYEAMSGTRRGNSISGPDWT